MKASASECRQSGTIYAVQTFAGPGEPQGLAPDEEPVALDHSEQMRETAQAARVRERGWIT